MKRTLASILTGLLCFLIGVGASQLRPTPQPQPLVTEVDDGEGSSLIFEGTVLKIAPPVPASGTMAWYRLAKYRIERVVYGRYPHSEIVVDHLSMSGEELNNIKVGDRVCVAVEKSKKILSHMYISGFREQDENVEWFYIGGEVDPNSQACR